MKQVTRNLRAIVALVLSSLILATSMLMVGPQDKKAYAAESEGPYEKLYYITDYFYSKNYVNNVILPSMEEVGLGEDSLVYEYIETGFFMDEIKKMYAIGYFSQINNSYVIFEMRQELLRVNNEYDNEYNKEFVYELNEIFSTLKEEQNCKIMIIFGTDEQALAERQSYTEFLNYADIVVNTNVWYVFIYNFINLINKIYEHEVTAFKANVMLSPIFCGAKGELNSESWLFTDCLVPYYLEFINPYAQGMQYGDIIDKFFISGNHYIGWADYWDYPDFSNSETLNNFGDLMYPVGLGMAKNSKNYSQWEEVMYEMRTKEQEFPIFVLNQDGAKVADWIQNGNKDENIFYSGNIAAILEYYIPLIMHDFIIGENLIQYDNWPGACDITFKPLFSGKDGWMEYPEVIQSWQVVFE